MLKKTSHLFVWISVLLFIFAVYTSASGLGASSVAAAVAICLHFSDKRNWSLQDFPKSSFFLLAIVFIGFLSFIANYDEASRPLKMLSKLKYYAIAGLWIPVLKSFLDNLAQKTKVNLLKVIFYSLFITIVIAGVYGYYFTPGARSHGLIGIMRFSYTLALLSPLVWLFALQRNYELSSVVPRWGVFGLLFIILICILTTQSRGGLIGFILGFMIAIFYTRRKAFYVAMSTLLLICTGLFFAKQSNMSFMKHRYFQRYNSNSNLMRISYYKSALYGIYEKPWLGFGMQRFPSQITRIKKKYDLSHKYSNAHSHNVILENGAQIGLLGLFSFFLWLIFWGREMYERGHISYYVCFVVVFLCIGQFEFIFFTNNMLLTFAIYHAGFFIPNKRLKHES